MMVRNERFVLCPLLLMAGLVGCEVAAGARQPPERPAQDPDHQHTRIPEPSDPGAIDLEPPAMPELEGPGISLAELERRTLAHNAEIFQARAGVAVVEGLRQQVGLYPNPVIGYSAEEIPLTNGRDTGKQGGFLSQTIVTGGKLRQNREIFYQEIERARARVEAVELHELGRVRTLYYQAVATQRLVAVHARLARLAREAEEITAQLFNTGAADQPDQLGIGIEAELAELDLIRATSELVQLWAQLASAVGDPELRPQRLEDHLDEDLPELTREVALADILRSSPEIRFAHSGLTRAERVLERARAEPIPDLEITAGVLDNREPLAAGGSAIGTELFAEVAVRIPLFDRNQGSIAAARADIERSSWELERVRLALRARFAPAFARYRQEYETARRYRDRILPQATRAYSLHLTRYRQMAAAYPQVLIAQRTLFRVEIAFVQALAKVWESAVAIESSLLVGELLRDVASASQSLEEEGL